MRASRAGICGALFVLVLAVLFAGPGLACAEWRQIPSPITPMLTMTVANAETWLAEGTQVPRAFEVTGDGGADWTSVQVPGFPQAFAAGAAGDGSFRILGARSSSGGGQESQVFRLSVAGELEAIGPLIEGPSAIKQAVAVSPAGETWVPHRQAGGTGFALTVVAAGGSSVEVLLPEGAGTEEWRARSTLLGMRLLHYGGGTGLHAYGRPTYRLEGAQVLPAEVYPVSLIDGAWEFSAEFGLGSWDGGASWSEQDVGVVPRVPSLGMPRYLTVRGGSISERYTPSLYRGTGLKWPPGAPTNYVVDAGPLIAWGQSAIFLEEGPLPAMPMAIGELQPDTQRLLARADVFRADAQLPPLTGDAQVSVASRNHSNYTALNPLQAAHNFHEEDPGFPGFTGVAMSERCGAVGTFCQSEIADGAGARDPVGDWLATIYHRSLIGAPQAGIVGAGEVPGGDAIIDGRQPMNVLVGPFGYPVGRWRGANGFSGETPDPVAACLESGQPISYPLGIAVSLYLPNREGRVSGIQVHRQGEIAKQPGCLQEVETEEGNTIGVFILDEPLVPGQTYEVAAVWNPGPDRMLNGSVFPSADSTYDWSFRFEPDSYGATPEASEENGCGRIDLQGLSSTSRQRQIRHSVRGVELELRLDRPARMSLISAEVDYRSKQHQHSARLGLGRSAKRSATVGRIAHLRIRLPRLLAAKLGSARDPRVRLRLAGHGVHCAVGSTFSRQRRISLGWVQMKGPVEWAASTSAHGKGRSRNHR